ncbi:hypothetical protein [Corynebacterium jeddahense]|uniref:Transposase n=1 Tax=Corynebacterium jeddahense TaxID=1414719 RepID=A0ABY7UQ02_9CORY|nr:hypothetical protein [Corynebacterium jeddahense]WCZ39618.1 hypothetical protein CJEDD_10240 [Corynebacterium jeddahense]
MPRKFSDEFKAKAVRLAEELVELEGCSKWGAAVEIGDKLGASAHTLNRLFVFGSAWVVFRGAWVWHKMWGSLLG